MTGEARLASSLMERLPPVRGRLTADAPLRRFSWFRTGGPADVLFEPQDEADLAAFLAACPKDVPLLVLGVGSNLLVRDGGVRGVVIRLGRAFQAVTTGPHGVTAAAGAMDVHVARAARDAGLAGLEFLVGVPGTIGGALAMNAGAYGRDMADVVTSARVLTRDGRPVTLTPDALGFSYRRCARAGEVIFLEATMAAEPGAPETIEEAMTAITTARSDSQPIGTRTGGSTFTNPPGEKAWELVDRAGCRGLRVGDAQISEKHTNFLINLGHATAHDIETLGEEVRRRVKAVTGVTLDWEIRRIGEPGPARKGEDIA
ncbi:UDP-N-acetylmuramate dehydrogenase [Yunchengibacter salinarum]|uniref:UDP-N-acetylmuramate dehydrogenase n=1 Tax=Yunchengibacter salinarum TaxID=3133399 RepID=UPI0035B59223